MPRSTSKTHKSDGTPRAPVKARVERLVFESGVAAASRMRLSPGQRPCVITDSPEEAAKTRRPGPLDRGPVTPEVFRVLKARWRCRTYKGRNAYFAHPLIRADVKAWAEKTLTHIPRPGMDTGSGSTALELSKLLEAWLNERRWPVEVSEMRMADFLREMGFGTRNWRWNCAVRTIE